MGKKDNIGSVRRFGARYGLKIRKKLGKIENLTKATYICKECSSKRVKRVSSGIWECSKCGVKFAGKAYVPHAK